MAFLSYNKNYNSSGWLFKKIGKMLCYSVKITWRQLRRSEHEISSNSGSQGEMAVHCWDIGFILWDGVTPREPSAGYYS